MVGFQPMFANIESCFAALTVAMLVPVAWLVVELSAPDGINPTSVATNVTFSWQAQHLGSWKLRTGDFVVQL